MKKNTAAHKYIGSYAQLLTKSLTAVALVSATLLSSFTFAQSSELPPVDPSREWLGAEYAEVIFQTFRQQNPQMPLVIDEKDLQLFTGTNEHQNWSIAKGIRGVPGGIFDGDPGFSGRAVGAVLAAFPLPLETLVSHLEQGFEIEIANDDTGTRNNPDEAALLDWVRSKPDGSIYPHEYMVKALEIKKGRVLSAWALAWNVARERWIYAPTRNHGSFISKFASMTGEKHLWKGGAQYVVLPEGKSETVAVKLKDSYGESNTKSTKFMKMVITKRGDEFSYLYHRIGVELFAVVMSKLTGSPRTGRYFATAGAYGEYLKYPLTAGLSKENKKRVNNDVAGAHSGSHLYELVMNLKQPTLSIMHSGPSAYLKSNPSKYGATYQILDGRPSHYFGSNLHEKFWAPIMSVEELTLRFYHATRVDSDVLSNVMLASTGELERLHRGLIEYKKQGANEPNLNGFIQDWLAGKRATPVKPDVNVDLDIKANGNHSFAAEASKSFDFSEVNKALNHHLRQIVAVNTKPFQDPRTIRVQVTGGALTCKGVYLVK